MNISLKSDRLSEWGKKILFFWIRFSRPFFLFLFFVALGWGIYVWYENLYLGEWSEEEKQAYAKSAFQETIFKEQSFHAALKYVTDRKTLHEQTISVDRDIFEPLPGFEKQ